MRLRCKVGLRGDSNLTSSQGNSHGGLFSVAKLVRVKQFALRRRVWFRVLSRVERGVLDLTVRYVNNVKSALLAKVLTAIMEKLALATESIVERMVRSFGSAQASKVSEVAVRLGNRSAWKWALDSRFARFLAVMHMNWSGSGVS